MTLPPDTVSMFTTGDWFLIGAVSTFVIVSWYTMARVLWEKERRR